MLFELQVNIVSDVIVSYLQSLLYVELKKKTTQVYRYREHIGGETGWEKWVSMVTIVNNCTAYSKVAKRSSKLSCQEKNV